MSKRQRVFTESLYHLFSSSLLKTKNLREIRICEILEDYLSEIIYM